MHYVSTENKDNLPILDDDNIIPVLVSAAFLKVIYAIFSDLVSFHTEILILLGIITSVNNFDDSFTKNLDTSRRPEQRRHL